MHAFRRIVTEFGNASFDDRRMVIFFGNEAYLARWAVEEVKKRYTATEIDYVRLGAESTADEIIAHADTLPMISKRRVVVVENFDAANGTKDICEYKVPETTILIFESKEVDKRKALYKAVNKFGGAYEFDRLESGDLQSFIAKRFKASEKKISREVLGGIIQSSGYLDKDSEYSIYDLNNDIKKIISHCDGEIVTMEDVSAAIEVSLEINAFGMLDAISSGNKDRAFELLRNILSSGESAYRLLGLITSQLEIMLFCKELEGERDIHKKLGVHEFRLRKAAGFARNFSREKLRQNLLYAFDIDQHIKTGVYSETLAMEMFLAKL